MSDILFASVPIHGHVAPLLPLARHLAARGDRVRFLTGSRFADAVRATGAEHIPLPAGADFDDRGLTSQYPERATMSPVKAIAFDFEHIFVRPAEHQFTALRAIIDAGVDVVVCDPLFFGGALLVEEPAATRPPVVVAGIVPLALPGPGLAPFGMGIPPLSGAAGRIRNAVLRTATRRMFRPVDAAADEVAARTIGRPLTRPVMDWLPGADVVAQLTVPAFEYPRPGTSGTLVFTGPVAGASAHTALPDWWADLDGERPVVHVTQGTIANDDLSELVIPTLSALAHEDVLVVVATGGAPVASLGDLPANARVADFIPYDALMPRVSAFVTNGGYGGVQFALAHGVPIVTAPGKEDKVEVAARVAWSGVGIRLGSQRPAPEAILRGVRSVLGVARYREAARAIAADMRKASGAPGFADAVDGAIARRSVARR